MVQNIWCNRVHIGIAITAMNNEAIIHDTWLSDILERKAVRVTVPLDAGEKRADIVQELCCAGLFAYAKVQPTEAQKIAWLEDNGFRLMDTNVVFDKAINAIEGTASLGHCTVRFAIAEDEEQTVELARRAFRFSRFHLDPQIPRAKADVIKAEWVRNYFRGERGDAMVIAEMDGAVVGFIQLLKQEERLLIDLIAVDEQHRRKNIASDMIAFAEANAGGCTAYVVGTQIANIPSMRLYERLGFRMAAASYVFHYHHSATVHTGGKL